MHLADLADIARPENLARRLQRLVVEALVAHLSRHLIFGRGFGQQVRFVRGARERLLAVHVLAVLHREQGDGGVQMIGRGDHHGIDVLALFVEQLAKIFVFGCVGVGAVSGSGAGVIDIAERHDVLRRGGALHDGRAARAEPDGGDIQLLVEGLVS